MSNLQGVWSLVSQYQAIGNNNWADPLSGNIGLFGRSPSEITFVNIATDGNTEDFGDHSGSNNAPRMSGSSTRAIFRCELVSNSTSNVIEFCEISRKSNTTDFGDVSSTLNGATQSASISNATRSLFAGGSVSSVGDRNTIEYITIANTGDSTDFGDLSVGRDDFSGLASTTRGVFGMGRSSGGDFSSNTIDYVTIGSTGNASDFGDMSVIRNRYAGTSSNTRGLFMGGYNTTGSVGASSSRLNTIDYITIASTGNASDFGDLTAYGEGGATSNSVKAIFSYHREIGFTGDSADTNTIDKVTIASTGNASDFGDAATALGTDVRATSDSHGGL